jgi:uncharacterized protein (TIGR02271 family)
VKYKKSGRIIFEYRKEWSMETNSIFQKTWLKVMTEKFFDLTYPKKMQNQGFWDSPPPTTANEGQTAARKAEETVVPITEERLDASKRESTREATITKEPVTETKTVEVPVTHEEISVERRPASGSTATTAPERPVQSKTETKVPLKQEEVRVTKQPYVKEEVSVNDLQFFQHLTGNLNKQTKLHK